jgi:tetratricopeptide (TPR) repeat protein
LGRILIPLGLVGLVFSRKRVGWPLAMGSLSGLLLSWFTFANEDGRLLSLACLAVGVPLWLDVVLRERVPRRLLVVGASIISVGIWGIAPGIGGAVSGLKVQGDDYFQLGALYDREQRGSSAIREYERALRLDPDNPYPRMAIAAMLARDNVDIEAIKELEYIRERNPEFVPALTALTRAYQEAQMWREASAAYGELVRLEPWNAEHWNNLATIYVQMALYNQAESALQRSLQINPDYRTARDNLQALRARGLVRGIPDGSNDQRAVQEQILDMIRIGNYPEADRILAGAYERFGRSATLVFIEGTLRLVSGEPERAVTLLESVRKTMADDPIFLNNLGAAYSQIKSYEKAKQTFEKGLRIQPSNVRLQQGLDAVEAALDSLSQGGG